MDRCAICLLCIIFNNLIPQIAHKAEICNLRAHRADELQTLIPAKLVYLAIF